MFSASSALEIDRFTTFGDLLIYLRRRAGLTQRELSIAVGYSESQISRLEQNLRLPDITTIAARFVEPLGLAHAPALATRLLDMATAARREDAPAPGQTPFKGLLHFDEGDAGLFFGREALTLKLVNRLLASVPQAVGGNPAARTGHPGDAAGRLLAIVGASGSGKSSLVRAGLVPALRWLPATNNWLVVVFTPTAHPLAALAAAVSPGASEQAAALARDPEALRQAVQHAARQAPAPCVLLVVDQFEEVFTLCGDAAARGAFIDLLLSTALSSEEGPPVAVVLTLRADFYAQCADHPALRTALAARQEYIGAMTREELRRAIEEPARQAGWALEPGLTELLLREVGAEGDRPPEPGALPLLSHALLATWQRRRGRTLTLGGYLASGGVRGAIAETAEAVFHDRLSEPQRGIARRIFLSLTEVGEAAGAIETRRRASIAELARGPEEQAAVHEVLTVLADARLVTTGQETAEVAHEALIREWPTLRRWLEEGRERLRLQRHLTAAAQEWQRLGREAGALYRGAQLAQATEWANAPDNAAALGPLDREFLAASQLEAAREAQAREVQRRHELETAQHLARMERARADEQATALARVRLRNRLIAMAGGLAAALAVLAVVFGLQSGANARLAQGNASTSEANYRTARAEQLAAEALTLIGAYGDPELAALLSLRSLDARYTLAGDRALVLAAQQPFPRQILSGHISAVYAVAFSPDGRFVLTGSRDYTARLWEADTGQVVRTFRHDDMVTSVAFAPDGQAVLSGSRDRKAKLWDVATGKLIRVFSGNADHVLAVAFSADGRFVLTGGRDKTARLWRTQTGELIQTYTGHNDGINSVAFSPDDHLVLTGSQDGTARLWEASSGQLVRTFAGHTYAIATVAFSPDGLTVLTGSLDKTARVWDAQTGQPIYTFAGHAVGAVRAAISPDGRYVATAGDDFVTRLWSTESGQTVRIYAGHANWLTCVAFSPDGQRLATGSWDTTVRLWEVGLAGEHPMLVGHSGNVVSLALAPDGRLALTGSYDGTARLWEVRTGQTRQTLRPDDLLVYDAALSPDGALAALVGPLATTVYVWDMASNREVHQFEGHQHGIMRAVFSPDGQSLLSGSWDGRVLLHAVGTGEVLHTLNHNGQQVNGLAFSADGQRLLTGGADNMARLWGARSGELLASYSGHSASVTAVAFTPDDQYVVTASSDKTARLWEARTGKEVRRFIGHTGGLISIVVSPDGRLLATGSEDLTARLWDLQTGQEVRRFAGHMGGVSGLAFLPDGQTLLTASYDGSIRQWSVDYRATVAYLCSQLRRDLTDEERAQYKLPLTGATCRAAD